MGFTDRVTLPNIVFSFLSFSAFELHQYHQRLSRPEGNQRLHRDRPQHRCRHSLQF